MKKKWTWLLIVSVIFSLILSACGKQESAGTSPQSKEKLELKMSVTVGETSTWFQAAEQFAKEVSDKTDGRITITVYPNEQLSGGDSGKGVELLLKGSTDLSYHSTIIYSILDERFGVVSAPFLFDRLETVDAKFSGEGGDAIKGLLREKGIEPLGFGQNGFRQVTNSVKPIQSPEDLEGLKIRIPGIKMYTDLWREFGADPATMTFSEVFTALQQNTIDGQENPIDVIYSAKLNEVQKHITMWNYSYDPLILGMNKKKFDSLHPDDQKVIQEAADRANAAQIQMAREKEAEQIQALKDAGMEFYEPTAEQMEAFKAASQPIYDTYKEKWGADLLKAFQ
jgi:tripartite ATP-independent transporter DctP family solute receptor